MINPCIDPDYAIESFKKSFEEWAGKTIEHVSLSWSINACDVVVAELKWLRKENEALQADQKRLEWWGKNSYYTLDRVTANTESGYRWIVKRVRGGFETFRDAIDAAMKEEKIDD